MIDFSQSADLWALKAVVAASPIVVQAPSAPPRDFAEWCARQTANLDVVVLDWLRSQVPLSVPH